MAKLTINRCFAYQHVDIHAVIDRRERAAIQGSGPYLRPIALTENLWLNRIYKPSAARRSHRHTPRLGVSMNQPALTTDSQINNVMNHAIRRSSQEFKINNGLRTKEWETMSAAQEGSTAAFDELQARYSRSLFKTILRITRNREDAEDALQDTFLRAFVALGSFEGRSSIYSWITRIAINSALMVLRHRARPRVSLDSSGEGSEGNPPHEVSDTALNPEQLCELRQRSRVLLCAIETLDPKLRVPLKIQLSDERSLKEIADALDISVPAVKARLYRARVHLAKRVSLQSNSKKHRSPALADKHPIIGPRDHA